MNQIIIILALIVDILCLFAYLYCPERRWPLILCLLISWFCITAVKISGVIE